MQSSDLLDVFGSIEAVVAVLAGRSQIDRSNANLLGQLFHVDPLLFVEQNDR